VLFSAVRHPSAIVDFVIAFGCLGLAFDIIRRMPVWIWFAAFAVVTVSSLAGLCFHFQDSGESGPLPYEWLNDYYVRSWPLLIIALGARLFLRTSQPPTQAVQSTPIRADGAAGRD
jgi:hypothetical protein